MVIFDKSHIYKPTFVVYIAGSPWHRRPNMVTACNPFTPIIPTTCGERKKRNSTVLSLWQILTLNLAHNYCNVLQMAVARFR